jgi:hypothetical protein
MDAAYRSGSVESMIRIEYILAACAYRPVIA